VALGDGALAAAPLDLRKTSRQYSRNNELAADNNDWQEEGKHNKGEVGGVW